MATIDLGKIKMVWRGTYAGGTAYVPDDVVEYTDTAISSTYICTTASTGNAPSSGGTAHASWAYLAKGASPSPTTTRGDIIYRGASADARLAKGTQGHYLKMGANDPEWAAIVGGGKVKQVVYEHRDTAISSTTADYDLMTKSITPTAATSNILVEVHSFWGGTTNPNGGWKVTRDGTALGATSTQEGSAVGSFFSTDDVGLQNSVHAMWPMSWGWLDQGPSGNGVGTTSAVEYKFSTTSFAQIYFNRNQQGSANGRSTLILTEIAA